MLGNFSCYCCRLIAFFELILSKIISGTLSESQAIWIQIKTDDLLVLIRIQNVCKGYQKTKVVASIWKKFIFYICDSRLLEYWVLTESRIALKSVLGGLRVIVLFIDSTCRFPLFLKDPFVRCCYVCVLLFFHFSY